MRLATVQAAVAAYNRSDMCGRALHSDLLSGADGSCQSCAERDTTGLCCPVKLSGVLSASFERTDKELLAHLEGALLRAEACLQDLVSRV